MQQQQLTQVEFDQWWRNTNESSTHTSDKTLHEVLGEKVVPNRTEHINQHSGLATDGTVIEIGFNVKTVAGAESGFDAIDKDIELATHNVADLGVRVSVDRTNGAGFKVDFGHQNGIVVSKQLTNEALADRLSGRPGPQHERFALSLHQPTPLLLIGSFGRSARRRNPESMIES